MDKVHGVDSSVIRTLAGNSNNLQSEVMIPTSSALPYVRTGTGQPWKKPRYDNSSPCLNHATTARNHAETNKPADSHQGCSLALRPGPDAPPRCARHHHGNPRPAHAPLPEPGTPRLHAPSRGLDGPSDAVRRRAHTRLLADLRRIAKQRGLGIDIDTFQENPAVSLDAGVIEAVSEAIAACAQKPLRLPSGAGHDAGIMAKLCPSGMIFLRCKDGISHNPAESITVEDADLGVRALLEAVRRLDRRLGMRQPIEHARQSRRGV
jgi:Peptidase family M20/M25/M40